MSCIAIIDTSTIIWDVNHHDQNPYEYLNLKNNLLNLMDVFRNEQPYVLFREELIQEIVMSFPYEGLQRHYDYTTRVFEFINSVPEERRLTCPAQNNGVTSTPILLKPHFSNTIQTEVGYVLNYLHNHLDDRKCFFTYHYLYGSNAQLITSQNGNDLQCRTIFFDDATTLTNYFLQFKKIFEHNPVHHTQNRRNSRKSMLRCYNGKDTIIPQKYLDGSFYANNRYYYYDPVNEVYVVFFIHQDNRYHGHEEPNLKKIPESVRRVFNV